MLDTYDIDCMITIKWIQYIVEKGTIMKPHKALTL